MTGRISVSAKAGLATPCYVVPYSRGPKQDVVRELKPANAEEAGFAHFSARSSTQQLASHL